MKPYTLSEAAKALGMSTLDFVRYSRENGINPTILDGKPMYDPKGIMPKGASETKEESPLEGLAKETVKQDDSSQDEVMLSEIVESIGPMFDPSGHYRYPAKERWRSAWGEFLSRNVPIDIGTTVLCLAGYGDEIPVYERIGIKRHNITALDKDEERIKHVQERYPGVQTVNSDLASYLAKTGWKFDIVMLDYDGRMSKAMPHLELLMQRRILSDKAALGINVYGSRETDDEKEIMLNPFFCDDLSDLLDKGERIDAPEMSLKGLPEARDLGISAIMLAMMSGADTSTINKAFRMLPSDLRRMWKNHFLKNPCATYKDFLTANYNICTSLCEEVKRRELPEMIVPLIWAMHARPYFPQEIERVSYNSAHSNNPFLSDFYTLDKRSELYLPIAENAQLSKFASGKTSLDDFSRWYNGLQRNQSVNLSHAIKMAGTEINDLYQMMLNAHPLPNRKSLDRDSEEPIDKQRVYDYFEEGLDISDIMRRHPNWAKGSLCAMKAIHSRRKVK